MLGALKQELGMDVTWACCAGMGVFGACVLLIALSLIHRRLKKFDDEKCLDLKNLTESPEVFAKFAAGEVEKYLIQAGKKSENLKYKPVQALVMARLKNSVPQLPSYDPATQGQEIRAALWEQLG